MRLLWEQHVYWTRMFLISVAFDLANKEFVTNRLLQNPKDFQASLIPFYGREIASKFEELLTAHFVIAAELVNAAKEGDTTAATDAEKRWYQNADQIAQFLSEINPFWSMKVWQKMLYTHLALTKEEAVNILTQQYETSITDFDKIEKQALEMADMMTKGMIQQFPDYFY
ncbi:acetylglutamate kinase [Candidatus Galacturonibacter soehngenii]|uniref:Acetylglutamate kinase n=2 Tax=Candidatus Galacturonatibacter soehngenii TaxID=2307010 RepID=A0A7V7QN75_9FIRM|nr:acetylglutamate kinase [Candidatus Galacturonibacter soehngenii]